MVNNPGERGQGNAGRVPVPVPPPGANAFLLLQCRPGFEKECAAECQGQAARLGVAGYVKAPEQAGYLRFYPAVAGELSRLEPTLDLRELTFPRQWAIAWELPPLAPGDRVGSLRMAFGAAPIGDLFIETADSDATKVLLPLCRQLDRPLRQALLGAGRLLPDTPGLPRGQVFFVSSTTAWVGYADPGRAAPWPMGIPRLRLPHNAASRSTLKLEEAILSFLSPAEQVRRLRPGMRAVDLGAAPGGWSWQLVRRGLQVTAVDNGPLQADLLATGRVVQRREDGFAFRPPQPVDWMVCDMVEQPGRIARLVATWLAEGWCRESLFNLKLPMRKRFDELQRCREIIARHLPSGTAFRLHFRHLYHDREEVTGYLRRADPS
jgi:23S rRNA (cytidine2498-2'-O)-methyltransferase